MRRTEWTKRSGPLVAMALGYLVVASGIMIWRGISVSPDYLLLLLVPFVLLTGRLVRFLRDWVPFIAIFLGWEAMRGIAPKAGIAPHVADLAHIELWLFGGHLPNAVLQSLTPDVTSRSVVSFLATVVYFMHFVLPIATGLALWLVSRPLFVRYTTALMGMAFAAFVIYLLVPTAPPWYAEQQGVIHGFQKLISSALPSAISPYYHSLNPNQVAAFPSLHAAFPFLSFLALRQRFPRASWFVLGWSFIVALSVVYLGEHYVIDTLAGFGLAAGAWFVLMRFAVPRVSVLQLPRQAPEETDTTEGLAVA